MASDVPAVASFCTTACELIDQLVATATVPRERDVSPSRLLIDRRAYWFQIDDQPLTSLRRRRALHRVLNVLATTPRVPVPSSQLVAAGWEDERMLPTAASARLRSAIATLRRLGLRDLLVTTGDGYMLDIDVLRSDL